MKKEGHAWMACYNAEADIYVAKVDFRGAMSGHGYYQITKETYDKLTPEKETESKNMIIDSTLLYKSLETSMGPVHTLKTDNWMELCKDLLPSNLHRI